MLIIPFVWSFEVNLLQPGLFINLATAWEISSNGVRFPKQTVYWRQFIDDTDLATHTQSDLNLSVPTDASSDASPSRDKESSRW